MNIERTRTYRADPTPEVAVSVIDDIKARCDEGPECGGRWNWTGNHRHKMHNAVIERNKVRVAVRKAVWVAHRGAIPAGKVLSTTCDNPCCLNPELAQAITRGDVVRRGIESGLLHNAAHLAARTKMRRIRQGTKLSLALAREIRTNSDTPAKEYAEKLGVSIQMVYRVRNNLSYRDEVVFRGLGARA